MVNSDITMKLQSNRTIYYDYHSCEVTAESPKQMYDCELKAGEDYEFARTGTVFTVEECEDRFCVKCKKFNIYFKDFNDMIETGWFNIQKGAGNNDSRKNERNI